MKNMNNVYVVEEDYELARSLINNITTDIKDVRVSGIYTNEEEIARNLRKLSDRDILILDLNREKASRVIKYARDITINPSIFVIAEEQNLLNTSNFYIVDKNNMNRELSSKINEVVSKENKSLVKHLVRKELSNFNFRTTSLGYHYLEQAVIMCVMDKSVLKSFKNNLYEQIAEKNNVSNPANIKWNVEKTVETIYKTTSVNYISEYFSVDIEEKTTPKMFIGIVADKVKNQLKSM